MPATSRKLPRKSSESGKRSSPAYVTARTIAAIRPTPTRPARMIAVSPDPRSGSSPATRK
jgi:hypothetical protein